MPQNSLCFASFVFGNYQKYIPYYIYSIRKTYPLSFVKIFVEKELDFNIKSALQVLQENNITNFEIVKVDIEYADYKNFKIKGGGGKLIRWLVGFEYFKEFEYVYIGDIDIFFLKEEVSVLHFHKAQLKQLQLPFSNKVRLFKDGNLTKRLTGLHFFKTKEYFEKVEPIISKIKKDAIFRSEYLQGLKRDEHFLYKINKEAFQFHDKTVSKAERPWHGLHLGITRGNKGVDLKVIKENSSLAIPEIKKQLLAYAKDPVFKALQKQVFIMEFAVILKELKIPITKTWFYGGTKYQLKYKIKKIKHWLKGFVK
ncbi:MAG: hypothetical protein ACPG6B_07490 [Oceanihabitans sp.]